MINYLKKQILISSIIYLGQALAGFSMGWSAPMIPKLRDPELTPLPEVVSDSEASLTATLLFVGTVIGPYVAAYLSNAKGRKPCLILAGVIMVLAFVLLALASNIIMIFIGRILIGAGVGIIYILNVVYIGEIASTNIRGLLLTIIGFFHTFGTLLVYSVGPYVPYAWTNWLGAALTVLYIAGLFTVPESPMFHVLVEDEKQAKDTLTSLGRPEDLDKIHLKITDTQPNWIQIFTVKINRKALFITLTLAVLQEMSGVLAVMFFATSIFEFAGSSIEPNIATIIVGVSQLASSVVAPIFVERGGRKLLLLFSTAFCFISLTVLGVYFWLDEANNSIVENIKWLPLASLVVFFLSFGPGFAIIPGTLMGEMFTSNVRSTGSIFVTTMSWVVGFGVTTAFSYMLPALGGAITFWVFAAACAVAFLFSMIFVPETKGKSLVEISEMLNK